jgi:hypothetical protein
MLLPESCTSWKVFLNSRSMDNLFLNRVIRPVEDAACGEADKPRGKDSPQV